MLSIELQKAASEIGLKPIFEFEGKKRPRGRGIRLESQVIESMRSGR
jgi:hypothetical protein